MANKKLSAVIQIGGAISSSLKKSLGAGTSALEDLGSAVKKLGKEQDRLKKASALEDQLKKDAQATDKARDELRRLRWEVKQTDGNNKKLNASLKQAEQNLYRLSAAEGKTKAKLMEMRTELKKAGYDTKNFAGETKRLGDAMDRLNAKRAKIQKRQAIKNRAERRQSELMGPFLGASMALGAFAFPIKAAMDYEAQLAEIRKTVGGTAEETNALGKSLLDLTKTMPVARSEIMEVAALAGQGGIAPNEIKEYTRDALMLGKAFGLSASEGSDALLSFRAGLKLSQKDAILLADAINLLGNNFEGVVSERGLTDFIQKQGATLSAAGLKPNQIAALGASMLASGAAPEVAATGAKNMTNALTKGDAATKGQRWAMSVLGLDPVSLAKNMQKNAPKAILDTLERIAKQPKFKQSAIVSKLFGEESKGAIMPLLVNTQALVKAFAQVADTAQYAGSMVAEYENQTDQSKKNLQLLGGALDRISVTVGQQILPALGELAGVFLPFAESVATWAEKNPETVKQLTLIVGGVLAATVAVTGLGLAIAGITIGFTTIMGIMNPFTWALVGLGALGVVIAGNWKKLQPVFRVVGSIFDNVSTIVGVLWGKLGDFFNMIGEKLPWVKNLFKTVVDYIQNKLEGFSGSGVLGNVMNVLNKIDDVTRRLAWGMEGPKEDLAPVKSGPSAPSVPFPQSKGAGKTTVLHDNSKVTFTINVQDKVDEAVIMSMMQNKFTHWVNQKKRGALYDH